MDNIKFSSGKFESIKLSLMKKNTDINDESKAEYTKYVTATFKMPEEFLNESPITPDTKYNPEYFQALLDSMFNDLMDKITHYDADSLGIWIKTSNGTLENAISLQTLKDIKEYSNEDTDPLYEFFKMTLSQ